MWPTLIAIARSGPVHFFAWAFVIVYLFSIVIISFSEFNRHLWRNDGWIVAVLKASICAMSTTLLSMALTSQVLSRSSLMPILLCGLLLTFSVGAIISCQSMPLPSQAKRLLSHLYTRIRSVKAPSKNSNEQSLSQCTI